MKKIRNSNENEMILSFLKGEFTSTRFNKKLNNSLKELGYKKEIILNGDLSNEDENDIRKNIMFHFRGYPTKELFENFPNIHTRDFQRIGEKVSTIMMIMAIF